jgi:hypothetical protein
MRQNVVVGTPDSALDRWLPPRVVTAVQLSGLFGRFAVITRLGRIAILGTQPIAHSSKSS